jgi:ABC-type glutathione transport system ATPase component
MEASMADRPLIEVRDLAIAFGRPAKQRTRGRRDVPGDERHVVDGVSFELRRGELLGVVGGSGSGKTTTLRAVLGHLPRGARVTRGSIAFEGRDLLRLGDAELRALRGRRIATIVQDPASALSPVRTVGQQMRAIAAEHGLRLSDDDVAGHLRAVGIIDPRRVAAGYPYEMSGGMAQRALIAIALSLDPEVLLADEPTSALDVTIQAQIMDVLRTLVNERDVAVMMVTHDIALVGEYCRRVLVMRTGEVVEQGPTNEVLYAPEHEYTRSLVAASRPLDPDREGVPS